MSATNTFKGVQTELAKGGFYFGAIDGIPGKKSDAGYQDARTAALQEHRATVPTSPLVPANGSEISQSAIDLILESEGVDQPSRWPGGGSGITLGYGCDIGVDPKSLAYWRDELTADQLERLRVALRVTGERAEAMKGRFRDIKISKEAALRVFHRYTLPIEIALAKAEFPGSEKLPPAALGAVVSVVFNRGTSRKGARRVDMQDIYDILKDGIQAGDLRLLAKQFRDMKKLWVGQGLDGLITRREKEALLVESCIPQESELLAGLEDKTSLG